MTEQVGTTGRAVVHQRGEGSAIWMLGGLYDARLTGAETGGALTLIEFTVPVGMGPPPHRHDVDETVYIIEGTARYRVGDKTIEVGPGSVLFLPKGTTETFEPTSTLRMLGVYTPGGIDRFFAEAGEPAERREIPPAPAAPPDFERLAGIASRHGLELLGPPPA